MPLIGAGLGAYQAPSGHHTEVAGRGAVSGFGLGAGALLGGLAGHAAGSGAFGTLGVGGPLLGAGMGALAGGFGGHHLASQYLGQPSWEPEDKPKHEHEHGHSREKEGNYPGCKSSRKHQARQRTRKERRVRRKHASAYLPWVLAGIIKRAAAEKCGCGCTDCAACGTKQAGEPKKKIRIQHPEVRTNGGQFAWRGRGAQAVNEDPSYAHFGTTKAGELVRWRPAWYCPRRLR